MKKSELKQIIDSIKKIDIIEAQQEGCERIQKLSCTNDNEMVIIIRDEITGDEIELKKNSKLYLDAILDRMFWMKVDLNKVLEKFINEED